MSQGEEIAGADGAHRAQVIDAVRAFAARDSELGRMFARRHGMHPTDAVAIVEILAAEQRGQTLTPARLAERIGLTAGATSTLLRRLESAGHVLRSHDHDDRRLVTLRSTESVHHSASMFFAPVSAALDEALRSFSTADLATTAAVLLALRDAASAPPVEGALTDSSIP